MFEFEMIFVYVLLVLCYITTFKTN